MAEWSHTKLQTYRECPRRYRMRYLDGLQPARYPAWYEFGRRFHEMAEAYARHCRAQGVPSDLGEARRMAEKWWGVDDALADAFVKWAENWQFDWSLTVSDGDSVERWIQRPLPGGDMFRGRLDLVLYNEAENRLWIIDYKTGFVLVDPATPPGDPPLQLCIYAWLASWVWRDVPAAVLRVYFVRTGTWRDWEVELPLGWVQRHIVQWIAEIQADEEFEPRPGPQCARCEYLMQCEAADPWRDFGLGEPFLPPSELNAMVVAGAWLQMEAGQARLQEVKAAIGEFVKANGPIKLPDGRVLDYWPPEYAGDAQQVPSLPKARLAEFIAKALEIGAPVEALVQPRYAGVLAAIEEYPELARFVKMRSPRLSLAARRPRPQEDLQHEPEHAFADL